MTIETTVVSQWRRFHDPKNVAQVAPATIHCFDDAASIIEMLSTLPSGTSLTAAGSHWSLSTSTVSDGQFVETCWPSPQNVPRNTGFALDLSELISDAAFETLAANPPPRQDQLSSDPCTTEGVGPFLPIHLKSGTRIFDAYSLLDRSPEIMTELAVRLNERLAGNPKHRNAYDGPWGFLTLGGAGGQTVFGALTTGTHGGDYRQKPLSDGVMGLHLVTEGGMHYWIEPSESPLGGPLTDDGKLFAHFNQLFDGGRFKIIRDNDIFRAVVVGAGRFGVVVSFVVRVVPQYCLHEHRRLQSWSAVKQMLSTDRIHHVFDSVLFSGSVDRDNFIRRFGPGPFRNRFLQLAVNLPPGPGGDHLCGVTQRWFYPPAGSEARDPNGNLRGRAERGTADKAGLSGSYVPPDDDSGTGGNTSFISRVCSTGNFIAGLVREAAKELRQIVTDNAVPAAGIAVAALGIGGGAAALAIAGLCGILAAAAILLDELADWIESHGDISLAETVSRTIEVVTNAGIPREVAIMLIRAIFDQMFRSEQSPRDFVAVSYAVMDAHDYLDRSCFGNAESIEVFFDARNPSLYCAYVDAILSFEAFQQEQSGLFSVGYVSLRYVLGSDALIAPSRFPETVAIEVSALRDAAGSVAFVENAARIARSPTFNASFHWGQNNPLQRREVERHFGDRLEVWRNALRIMTDDGTRQSFSNNFTRQTGLEPF